MQPSELEDENGLAESDSKGVEQHCPVPSPLAGFQVTTEVRDNRRSGFGPRNALTGYTVAVEEMPNTEKEHEDFPVQPKKPIAQ